jgi:hypothetical protein
MILDAVVEGEGALILLPLLTLSAKLALRGGRTTVRDGVVAFEWLLFVNGMGSACLK